MDDNIFQEIQIQQKEKNEGDNKLRQFGKIRLYFSYKKIDFEFFAWVAVNSYNLCFLITFRRHIFIVE